MQDGSPDFGVRHVHPGCQPPSDEGCCRDARSPGPHLTQGEVQTTPNASVTPHQQQPPTQQPQPRHTTLPRLRPRTWTWMTPNAYLPRVCFGRRPAVRRKPHKYIYTQYHTPTTPQGGDGNIASVYPYPSLLLTTTNYY